MMDAVVGGYRITGLLASGGMGQVYRARHEVLGKLAAVKVLRSQLSSSEELVQRFFTEAKAASAIRHPGIIEVYDFGFTADGQAYLVMELLDGESLEQRLARLGRLDRHCAGGAGYADGRASCGAPRRRGRRGLQPGLRV